jgi:tRNA-Thr(GGU) m(6)t(6)A37 methyltransferase TsaA
VRQFIPKDHFMDITYRPIGIIHTPFQTLTDMPIQPSGSRGIEGNIEVFDDFAEALADLEGFSHLILLYHFHQSQSWKARVKPFLDDEERGLFATRAPKRPNAIGLSVIEMASRSGNRLHVRNVDILDGTPLLDIKPYVPEFDHPGEVQTGWLEKCSSKSQTKRSDDRFC